MQKFGTMPNIMYWLAFLVESISADFSIVGNSQMGYSRTLIKLFLKKPKNLLLA